VKESSHLLHGSMLNTDARHMQSGARQTSVLRVGTRAGPSRRTHRSGTGGTVPPPGETRASRSRTPGWTLGALRWRRRPNQNESSLQRLTAVSR